MKALLGILAAVSMTSSIGGAIPSLLITNNQQNNFSNFNVNPQKSEDDILISEKQSENIRIQHLYIRPGTFEDIAHSKKGKSNQDFAHFLLTKLKNEFGGFDGNQRDWDLVQNLSNNWNEIYNSYSGGSKVNRIILNFRQVYDSWSFDTTFLGSKFDNSRTYYNVYFDNLNEAFNGELSDPADIDLKVTKDTEWDSIKDQLLELYPNLGDLEDFDKIEIHNVEPYSHFTQGYSVKLKVNSDAKKIALGIIPVKFILNTQENFDEINSIIQKDQDVQMWKSHLSDFNTKVERQIKEDVPNFSEAEKRTWRDTNAEIMKGYIRDWSIIQRLLFDELKIDELWRTVDKIGTDLNNLVKEIQKIKDKINEITSGGSNAGCDKINTASKIAKYIPEVGSILSAVFKVMGTLCDIQAASNN